jgi:hypothetical protein
MLFLIGIDKMNTEEHRQLLAQLQSFDSLLVIKEGAMDSALKAKHWIAAKSAGLAEKAGRKVWQERLQELDRKSDWEVIDLQEIVENKMKELQMLKDYEVRAYLKEDIARLVGLPRNTSPEDISRAYLAHMAGQFKIPNWESMDPGKLERKLYERCLEEQIDMIKNRLRKLNSDEEQEIKEILQKQIEALSHSEYETMRQVTGLDDLTGTAVLNLFKTSSALAIAQILISSSGFGAYLFLTTMIKAISLLLGITFSFGLYTGATAVMAFVLSPMFLGMFLIGGGGILWWQTRSKLNDYLIKAVFMAGKAKMGIDS